MRNQRGVLTVAILTALAVFGAILFWFGPLHRVTQTSRQDAAAPSAQPAPVGDKTQNAAAPASPSQDAKAPTASAPAAQPPQAAKTGPTAQPEGAAKPQEPAKAQEPADEQAADKLPPPAFDVVRVEPNGDTVIAGRAAPGATVDLMMDGKSHARVVADPSGLFAMTPPALPPGTHDLSLQFITPDGKKAVSRQSVAVSVNADLKSPPLVALAAPGKPTVVLSKPPPPKAKPVETAKAQPEADSATTPEANAAIPHALQIASVESDTGGKLYVSGKAMPGATLRLYLNDSYLASGTADPKGEVSFSIAGGVGPGHYEVRLDEVDPVTGKVKARAQVPFDVPSIPAEVAQAKPEQGAPSPSPAASPSAPQAAAGQQNAPPAEAQASKQAPSPAPAIKPGNNPILVPQVRTTIVARGDSLWRISRRIYGEGIRYTTIYDANEGQIRNPDLIYPGQVFVLPNREK